MVMRMLMGVTVTILMNGADSDFPGARRLHAQVPAAARIEEGGSDSPDEPRDRQTEKTESLAVHLADSGWMER